MSKLNIDKLNVHLFETIEMLKNNSDPNADPQEKMNVETAKQIAEISKVIIDGFKVKVMAMNVLARADNPETLVKQIADSGIIPDNKIAIKP